ncbi:MAG: hypothetical protein HC819_23905 [Cyclobacteriaceae bacterium]|nr:hypothetical protein [Cyclobacteriaceae bacterium]
MRKVRNNQRLRQNDVLRYAIRTYPDFEDYLMIIFVAGIFFGSAIFLDNSKHISFRFEFIVIASCLFFISLLLGLKRMIIGLDFVQITHLYRPFKRKKIYKRIKIESIEYRVGSRTPVMIVVKFIHNNKQYTKQSVAGNLSLEELRIKFRYFMEQGVVIKMPDHIRKKLSIKT